MYTHSIKQSLSNQNIEKEFAQLKLNFKNTPYSKYIYYLTDEFYNVNKNFHESNSPLYTHTVISNRQIKFISKFGTYIFRYNLDQNPSSLTFIKLFFFSDTNHSSLTNLCPKPICVDLIYNPKTEKFSWYTDQHSRIDNNSFYNMLSQYVFESLLSQNK